MRLSRYFLRRRWDEERADEIKAHLAHEIDDNLERGMTAEEARRHAYIRLGNPTRIREQIWTMNSFSGLGRSCARSALCLQATGAEPLVHAHRNPDAWSRDWIDRCNLRRA